MKCQTQLEENKTITNVRWNEKEPKQEKTVKKTQEQRVAKKKSKKMKPKQGTGLKVEKVGKEDLTYVKLNSIQRIKSQTVNRTNT